MPMRCLLLLFVAVSIIFFTAACSTGINDGKKVRSKPTTEAKCDNRFLTYTNIEFDNCVMSFQYPVGYVAEAIENGRCIGKPVKTNTEGDDPRTNTMDCCIFLHDSTDAKPIDTLIAYEIRTLGTSLQQQRDTVVIANTKGIRIVLYNANKNTILKQLIYFVKYNTLFEVINERLNETDFQTFTHSLRIEK